MENNNNKLCFVICHRYNKKYKSYIKYYIDNIQKFYKDSFVLLVDNNSPDTEFLKQFENYKNMKIITNNSLSKRELGAYNEGIRYIKQHNLLLEYEYFIFSQDTFVLKNKFDVKKELSSKDILACSFVKIDSAAFSNSTEMLDTESVKILKKINCFDKREKFNICWANSFILHKSKVMDYYEIVKDKVVITKRHGCVYERYLSGILYYLNNYNYVSLLPPCSSAYGHIMFAELGYNCFNVDLENVKIDSYFVKRSQNKI